MLNGASDKSDLPYYMFSLERRFKFMLFHILRPGNGHVNGKRFAVGIIANTLCSFRLQLHKARCQN